jgi:hypothetical protein
MLAICNSASNASMFLGASHPVWAEGVGGVLGLDQVCLFRIPATVIKINS